MIHTVEGIVFDKELQMANRWRGAWGVDAID
jgi:hypothetical protein